jgi:hypothetical protein
MPVPCSISNLLPERADPTRLATAKRKEDGRHPVPPDLILKCPHAQAKPLAMLTNSVTMTTVQREFNAFIDWLSNIKRSANEALPEWHRRRRCQSSAWNRSAAAN